MCVCVCVRVIEGIRVRTQLARTNARQRVGRGGGVTVASTGAAARGDLTRTRSNKACAASHHRRVFR